MLRRETSPPKAGAETAAGVRGRWRGWRGLVRARYCDAGLSVRVRVRVFARVGSVGSAVVGDGGCWNCVGRSWCLRVSLAARCLPRIYGPVAKARPERARRATTEGRGQRARASGSGSGENCRSSQRRLQGCRLQVASWETWQAVAGEPLLQATVAAATLTDRSLKTLHSSAALLLR
jgi:hypothetical protein